MFDWDRTFVNTKVNEKVFILNKTILIIVPNFIQDETLTTDDKEKNIVYKSYRNSKINNNTCYLKRLKVLQEDLHNTVSKLNYYS